MCSQNNKNDGEHMKLILNYGHIPFPKKEKKNMSLLIKFNNLSPKTQKKKFNMMPTRAT